MHFSIQLIALYASLCAASTIPMDKVIRQATNGRDPGTIVWICTGNQDPAQDIPEVCKNMCYGAYCRGYGTSLTWDKYAGRTKDERAKSAGCGRNNHCATDPPGTGSYQCDEYPFGSTSDADRTDRSAVNRCVPSGQNNRQGARLSQLFNSKGPWANGQGLNGMPPAQFKQSFSASSTLTYCGGATSGDACLNDGLQYGESGKIVDAIAKRADQVPREHFTYRLHSGQTITVPDVFEIGHRVLLPREHNSTLLVEQSEIHNYDDAQGLEQFDYMTDNLFVDEDYVVERLT